MHRNRYQPILVGLLLAFTGAAYAQKVGDISCDPKDPTNCSRWNGTKWVKVTCGGKEKAGNGTNGYNQKDGGYSNFGENQGKEGRRFGDDFNAGMPAYVPIGARDEYYYNNARIGAELPAHVPIGARGEYYASLKAQYTRQIHPNGPLWRP